METPKYIHIQSHMSIASFWHEWWSLFEENWGYNIIFWGDRSTFLWLWHHLALIPWIPTNASSDPGESHPPFSANFRLLRCFPFLGEKKRNDVLNPSKLDNTPPITPEMRPKSHAHVVVVVYYLPPLRSGLKQLWVGCLAWKRLPSADQTWFAGELHMCPLICFFKTHIHVWLFTSNPHVCLIFNCHAWLPEGCVDWFVGFVYRKHWFLVRKYRDVYPVSMFPSNSGKVVLVVDHQTGLSMIY